LTAGTCESVEKVREILDSQQWQELRSRLTEYVTNFHYKVVPATGRFQM
jgi:hypothetical protein